jgi:hypothetical protein
MGFSGVELNWKTGSDENWVSYYEIFRDGVSIDRVAKGTYYFDHSVGADVGAKYEVCTVDGAGNRSAKTHSPAAAERDQVIDDAPGSGIQFTGEWEHPSGLQPAYDGTISTCGSKGATAEARVRGKRILVFCKLGADCGMASVSIDGGTAETIDTYDADDLWGAGIFQKELAGGGEHTVRITVLGEKNPRASKAMISIDGIRGEAE